MSKKSKFSVINDVKIEQALQKLHQKANKQIPGLIIHYLPQLPGLFTGKGIQLNSQKTDFYKDKYIPIEPEQGNFLYLLARSINAKTIVEFGTSFGISTIYLAAAVRDNGGRTVIGTEIIPEKVIQARQNLAEAGLENYVDIREGNAIETLQNLDREVDMLLVDGWADLALDILKLVDPSIRKGGIVVSDNVGIFKQDLRIYVGYLQDPKNGYCSTTLNLKGGTEFAVKVEI